MTASRWIALVALVVVRSARARSVRASVSSPDWPSTAADPLCEAWAWCAADPDDAARPWAWLDAAVERWNDDEEDVPAVERAVAALDGPEADRRALRFALTIRAHAPYCERRRREAARAAEGLSAADDETDTFATVWPSGRTVTERFVEAYAAERGNVVAVAAPRDAPPGDDETPRGYVDVDDDDEKKATIVLYGNPTTEDFRRAYRELVSVRARLVVRFHALNLPSTPTVLRGYGVRLDIKNMEYKSFDDDDDHHHRDRVDGGSSASSRGDVFLAGARPAALAARGWNVTDAAVAALGRSHRVQRAAEASVPPTWQTRKVPLQAATVLSTSRDPLSTLRDLAQNLPSRANHLVRVRVGRSVRAAAEDVAAALAADPEASSSTAPPFEARVDGRRVFVERPSFNMFELAATLREETATLRRLAAAVPFPGARRALRAALSCVDGDPVLRRVDVARGGRGAVLFVNDVERDAAYATYDRSLRALPYADRGAPPPRRNLYTMTIVADPSSGNPVPALTLALFLLQTRVPLRVGLLIVDAEDATHADADVDANVAAHRRGPATAAAFREIVRMVAEEVDGHAALNFLYHILQLLDKGETPTLERVLRATVEFLTSQSRVPLDAAEAMVERYFELTEEDDESDTVTRDYVATYRKTVDFCRSKRLRPGMSFYNGIPLPEAGDDDDDDENEFQRAAYVIVKQEQTYLTDMVVDGRLTDRTRSIYAKVLTGPHVHPRHHPLLAGGREPLYVAPVATPEPVAVAGAGPSDSSSVELAVLFEAVLRLDAPRGLARAGAFLDAVAAWAANADATTSAAVRVVSRTDDPVSVACAAALRANAYDRATIDALRGWLETEEEASDDDPPSSAPEAYARWRRFAARDERVAASTTDADLLSAPVPAGVDADAIVANGRAYALDDDVAAEDLELLVAVGRERAAFLTNETRSRVPTTDLPLAVAAATAALATVETTTTARRRDPIAAATNATEDNPLYFSWNDDEDDDEAALQPLVTVVLDPLSEAAQRAASILLALRDDLRTPLRVLLAPRTQIDGTEGLPLASYYRFVAADADAAAVFERLPAPHVLTLRPDVPESWNVQQHRAVKDADNLRCAASDDGGGDEDDDCEDDATDVEFRLSGLIVFGSCYDATRGDYPNGLQLTLTEAGAGGGGGGGGATEIDADGTARPAATNNNKRHYSDTLVMKNLGYWQLRIEPGVWDLSIAEGSVGSKAFEFVDAEVDDHGRIVERRSSTSTSTTTKRVVVQDFVNRGEYLYVRRTPDYSSVGELPLGAPLREDDAVVDDDDVVHVFSLATGHLYERFLKIMMLSVTKRTSTKVKFWLFENFLSPSFKGSARAMAREIGCDVEFVTYKWPEWLRGQSEKQRIIWGYKILFLDVLFPLHVKKIIYVDADQVVRGDLKELRDLDLQGAPYGYTPFCDSRESTLGYQFWRSGFWKNHLRGKPYHISALYVVDLERFRRELVGDRLRGTYQSLSADPHSLSNLDQDLPNFAQHEVRIRSLPQEWLWCESWCSDDTKKHAKTIDLCNNPRHKEPKVSMAKRIISGDLFEESWVELDEEVERYDEAYRRKEAARTTTTSSS